MIRMLYKQARRIFDRFPAIRPLMRFLNRTTLRVQAPRPLSFVGWGMQTEHALPWTDQSWSGFRESQSYVISHFEFPPHVNTSSTRALEELKWRNWTVCWAVEYALRFRKGSSDFSMVECGVAGGMTSLFALSQASMTLDESRYSIHLYDSWREMQSERLRPDEAWQAGSFAYNSLERARRNLRGFESSTHFYPGYIPESFSQYSGHPEEVHYLSIDLDSADATLEALKFFCPRLADGSIIFLNDIGHPPFASVREAASSFLGTVPGLLMLLPTGNGLFFVNR